MAETKINGLNAVVDVEHKCHYQHFVLSLPHLHYHSSLCYPKSLPVDRHLQNRIQNRNHAPLLRRLKE